MPDPKIEQPLLIPHEGRKPDWLEDDARITAPAHDVNQGGELRADHANWLYLGGWILPADHWAAPVLRLRTETGENWLPWNAKLQGDGPPKDCAADGQTMMFGGHILNTNNLSFADHGTGRLIGYLATPAQHPGWTERGKQWLADGAPVAQQQKSGEGVEPVAWMYHWPDGSRNTQYFDTKAISRDALGWERGWTETPLYAHPPAQPVEPAAGEVVDGVAQIIRIMLHLVTTRDREKAKRAAESIVATFGLTHSPAPSAAIERLEGVPKRWAGVIELVEQITADEGAHVSFTGQNPDFNGLPDEAVTVCSPATGWVDATFRADSLADCLRATLSTKDADHG